MGAIDEQATEREVLESIFEGDERFKKIADDRYQYLFGEKGHYKSFLLEVAWPSSYPDELPSISLDLFYNSNLFPQVRKYIVEQLTNEAKNYLGMAVTFTLIEYAKENFEDFLKDQTEVANAGDKAASDEENSDSETNAMAAADAKKVQMTKAQKRRMWDRTNAANLGELERGWNWVDVVHHLSQTRDS